MTAPAKNRGGRPRDPQRDVAILDAVIRVLAENGMPFVTMDTVAAEAGAGKATVYRRWSTKEQLIADAIAERPPVVTWHRPAIAVALEDDLHALLAAFTSGHRALAGLALLSSLPYEDELRLAWGAGHAAALATAIGELCARAQARGTTSVQGWGIPVGEAVKVMQHQVLTTGGIPTPATLHHAVDRLFDQLHGRVAA